MTVRETLVALTALLLSCASDIKGEKGDTGAAGQDASAITAISLRRPDFYSTPSNTSFTELIVPGSSVRPAQVVIGGTIYSNPTNTTLEVNTSGSNPYIDTGIFEANQLYYLYAIPGSGTNFALIASLNNPNVRPVNHDAWSYLGAFITHPDAPELVPFTSIGGSVFLNEGNYKHELPVTSTTDAPNLAEIPLQVPYGARVVRLRALLGAYLKDDSMELSSYTSGQITAVKEETDGSIPIQYLAWPVVFPQKIYGRVSRIGVTGYVRVLGWTENPAEFP